MTVPQTPLEGELALLIAETLQLETPADAIDPEAPLFGEGLGLDSIDALELSLAIAKRYGVELRSDDDGARRALASLRRLAEHVAATRAR